MNNRINFTATLHHSLLTTNFSPLTKTHNNKHMAYDKFNVLTSTAVPLPIENVDTDQIIPARFLKATTREGFGDNLFRDWRYNADDTPQQEFILNNPIYSGKILVGGTNFGSGSSREHAAWAIYDYGFRAVVSSFFADIFKNNAINMGILPVQVSPAFLEKIFSAVEADPKTVIEISLPAQTITLVSTGEKESFNINGYKKNNLLNGYDDIDYLQAMRAEIISFAKEKAI
jgi:3-isopropylmalate/(R)-2-methylmalate dehydratase small subunit